MSHCQAKSVLVNEMSVDIAVFLVHNILLIASCHGAVSC